MPLDFCVLIFRADKYSSTGQDIMKEAELSMPPAVQALSDRFDSLFGDGSAKTDEFAAGAQAGHELIIDNYLSHTGKTNWINFTNIGAWGDNVVDRSSITELIQYGNGYPTAAYFHAFKDEAGAPLDGNNGEGYVLTFRASTSPGSARWMPRRPTGSRFRTGGSTSCSASMARRGASSIRRMSRRPSGGRCSASRMEKGGRSNKLLPRSSLR